MNWLLEHLQPGQLFVLFLLALALLLWAFDTLRMYWLHAEHLIDSAFDVDSRLDEQRVRPDGLWEYQLGELERLGRAEVAAVRDYAGSRK